MATVGVKGLTVRYIRAKWLVYSQPSRPARVFALQSVGSDEDVFAASVESYIAATAIIQGRRSI